MQISASDFERFRQLLEQYSGILLGENKQYLVSSRLSQFMKNNQFESLSALNIKLAKPGNDPITQQVIDLMTTNETLWFRDSYPFQFISNKLIPELKNQSQLRILCAACSSGQEPYSLSMLLSEASVLAQSEIVATDLSSQILEKAKSACYRHIELRRGMPEDKLRRHFSKINDDTWHVNQKLRDKVSFKALNLLSVPYSMGKFDIIFCRNVLIYFSQENKTRVLNGLVESLKPGGYLFLGASESLTRKVASVEMIRCNPGLAYRKF